MKHALGIFGVVAALVLLGVSAAMNWRFGYGLGKTEFDSQIYGTASAAADWLKALLPFFIFAAFRNKNWSQTLAASVLWTVCLTYSMTSSLGFAALNRTDTIGARSAQADVYKDLRADLKRATDKFSWMPEHRPVGMVESEIAAMQQNNRWRTTAGCIDVTTSKSRVFCEGYFKLNSELAVAHEANKLEARIAITRSKLEVLPSGAIVANADPQASVLAKLTGQSSETVQLALIILVAILVEVGSSLGLFVAFSQWNIYDKRNPMLTGGARGSANDNANSPRLVAPETDVERFHRERTVAAEGLHLTATALYEDYCAWCELNKKEPMALPTFGRQFGDLGIQKAKINGRIRYIGIRLTAAEDAKEDMPLAA